MSDKRMKCNKCGSTEMEGMEHCTPMRFADKVGDTWAVCAACQKEENDLALPLPPPLPVYTTGALFALSGEEQIVFLLKKVIENQDRMIELMININGSLYAGR